MREIKDYNVEIQLFEYSIQNFQKLFKSDLNIFLRKNKVKVISITNYKSKNKIHFCITYKKFNSDDNKLNSLSSFLDNLNIDLNNDVKKNEEVNNLEVVNNLDENKQYLSLNEYKYKQIRNKIKKLNNSNFKNFIALENEILHFVKNKREILNKKVSEEWLKRLNV